MIKDVELFMFMIIAIAIIIKAIKFILHGFLTEPLRMHSLSLDLLQLIIRILIHQILF